MATYTEQLQRIANKYLEEMDLPNATAMQMANWAIKSGLWKPQPSKIIRQCADELARAMREEYTTDPQGRRVRAKHVAIIAQEGKQTALWADIRTATREHLEIAFQQRRQQIVGDCRQLKSDADSYNENRNPGNPIQIVFDFTLDLQELELVY
jgi:hypothetical protein